MPGTITTNGISIFGNVARMGVLRAAGETTRLRLLALLADGEQSVKDLTEILGQSQPRVSRHLKLLADAGLVSIDDQTIVITDAGRPLVRLAAAAFDTYLPANQARHSLAV